MCVELNKNSICDIQVLNFLVRVQFSNFYFPLFSYLTLQTKQAHLYINNIILESSALLNMAYLEVF
jgi:hypothetical protein